MIDVVTSSFYIKAHDFDKETFELYSSELFDLWDRRVAESLSLEDYSLTLVVEEGSIKGSGKVIASLTAVYFAIGNYGGFISGLSTIGSQAAYVTDALFHDAKNTFHAETRQGNTKQNGGAIAYLEKLFYRVQRGDITAEDAMREVKQRFGDEATSIPGFMEDLESSLREAPKVPEQLTFEDEDWPESFEEAVPETAGGTRIPKPAPQPIPSYYRIEITRDSRRNTKIVTVTKVR